jgi:hypothetical protein
VSLLTWGWKQIQFSETLCFSSNYLESGRWTKSETPLILCVTHHRQNPIESTSNTSTHSQTFFVLHFYEYSMYCQLFQIKAVDHSVSSIFCHMTTNFLHGSFFKKLRTEIWTSCKLRITLSGNGLKLNSSGNLQCTFASTELYWNLFSSFRGEVCEMTERQTPTFPLCVNFKICV